MNFIELFNGVITLVKPVSAEDSFAQSMDDEFLNLNLDSLDYIMLSMYFGDVYGIDESIMQELKYHTVQELYDLLMQHKTQTPTNAEEALGMIQ